MMKHRFGIDFAGEIGLKKRTKKCLQYNSVIDTIIFVVEKMARWSRG